jgi:hypothetical protein
VTVITGEDRAPRQPAIKAGAEAPAGRGSPTIAALATACAAAAFSRGPDLPNK